MVDEQEVERRTAVYIEDMPDSSKVNEDPDELWGNVYEMIQAQMEYEEQKPEIDADIKTAQEQNNT